MKGNVSADQAVTRREHPPLGIESFNGRLRDELLNLWRFDSLREARVIIEDWRIDDNTNRPHTAHGDQTPAEFAAAWTTINEPEVA